MESAGLDLATTVKAIAQQLGISTTHVQRALTNRCGISEKTRLRVLQSVQELNYIPNLNASSLITGKTYCIGLLVPDLLHPDFTGLATTLSAMFARRGYCLFIAITGSNPHLEEQEANSLRARRPDALIIVSPCMTPVALQRIHEQGPPCVLIKCGPPNLDINCVRVDDEAIGALATQHLIEVGCQRIAHLRGPNNFAGNAHLKGYVETLAKHDLRLGPEYVSQLQTPDLPNQHTGADAMAELLALSPRPDGVFCYDDHSAIGAIRKILQAGLRIPEDIAVIGSGNLHFNDDLAVPLSSVDQRTSRISELSTELILSILESKTPQQSKAIVLQPRLVVRTSSNRKCGMKMCDHGIHSEFR